MEPKEALNVVCPPTSNYRQGNANVRKANNGYVVTLNDCEYVFATFKDAAAFIESAIK